MNLPTVKPMVWKGLLIAAMVALCAFVFYYFVLRDKPDDSEQTASSGQTANLSRNDIVNQFTPAALTPITPTPVETSQSTEGVSVVDPTPTLPRGVASTGTVLGTSTTVPQTGPTVSTTPKAGPYKEYRSDEFGFIAASPNDAGLLTDETTTTSAHPGGSNYWIISVYKNNTETLQTIETQLSRSPSVTKVTYITYAGEPALEFQTNTSGGKGIAVIHNQRLYYIYGNPINFRFI